MVLERLLPGFELINNWKSSIRRGIREQLLEYKDRISSIKGRRKVSDIVFEDIEGTLTEHLIAKEYLDRVDWEIRRPTYYIEVKATLNACERHPEITGPQHEHVSQCKARKRAASV